jgi:hypothetical protein
MSTVPDTPTLLPDRAFVVEFSGGAAARDGGLSGRVEHVLSGQAARFASAGELLEFVQGVLHLRKPTQKRRSAEMTPPTRRRNP